MEHVKGGANEEAKDDLMLDMQPLPNIVMKKDKSVFIPQTDRRNLVVDLDRVFVDIIES